jgi:putative nucleotidyltransferase with HDIG domain
MESNDIFKILIVDDDERNLFLLESILLEENYQVFIADSGEKALSIVENNDLDLFLLDIVMPVMDGFELCKRLKQNKKFRDIPVIFITGSKQFETIIKSFELGAADYIDKPFNELELLARVKTQLKLKNFQDNLEDLVKIRTKELQEEIIKRKKIEENLKVSNVKLEKLMQDDLNILSSVIEIRDPFTSGHQQNVTKLATAISNELGLSKDVIEGIRVAAKIHDIGKIKIPLEILSKGGKLMDLEMEIIKTHPETGFELLKDIDFPWPIADIVYQHHERLDGSGYPQGLTESDIIFEAKILGVADVVEAIAYHRPYRAALGLEAALKEIENNRGILYDPEIVKTCLLLFNERRFKF